MIYMGSKNRITDKIIPLITAGRDDKPLYDVFCGGCNVVDKVQGKRIANDSNPYLIAMWVALQQGWNPQTHYTLEEYTDIKYNKDKHPAHVVGYVGFQCSFNSRFFVTYKGYEVQTRQGVRDYQAEAKRNIMRQVPLIAGVMFTCEEYDKLTIEENAIVYCDPPYHGVSGYRDKQFDHLKFWDWCRQTVKRCTLYVSEYTAPDDFVPVWSGQVNRNVCLTEKTKVTEKLWTHVNCAV